MAHPAPIAQRRSLHPKHSLVCVDALTCSPTYGLGPSAKTNTDADRYSSYILSAAANVILQAYAHVLVCVDTLTCSHAYGFCASANANTKNNGYASCILIAAANGACPPARLPAGPPACPPANPPARRPAGPPTCPARPARLTACPSTCLPYSQHQSTYSQHTVNIQSTSQSTSPLSNCF